MSGYLTVAAVAEEFAVSPRTVLRWIEREELVGVRLPGGRLRISQTAYLAFIAERATTADRRKVVANPEEE